MGSTLKWQEAGALEITEAGMVLTEMAILELRWLARQTKPVWQLVPEGDCREWMEAGFVKREGDGYVITEAGRKAAAHIAKPCPTCGQDLHNSGRN